MKQEDIQELDYEKKLTVIRAALENEMLALDRAALKMTRKGQHIQAAQCMRRRAEIKARLEKLDNVEAMYSGLEQNKEECYFLIKTMMLLISSVDLATYYTETVQKFFERHNAARSVETQAIEEAALKSLYALRRSYAGFIEKTNRTAAVTMFDELERNFAASFFTDRERVYYDEYTK